MGMFMAEISISSSSILSRGFGRNSLPSEVYMSQKVHLFQLHPFVTCGARHGAECSRQVIWIATCIEQQGFKMFPCHHLQAVMFPCQPPLAYLQDETSGFSRRAKHGLDVGNRFPGLPYLEIAPRFQNTSSCPPSSSPYSRRPPPPRR